MLPPPDFDALTERLEHGRRASSPLLLFLGRACGRLAGSPDLEDLARQALALLDPERQAVQGSPSVDQGRFKELHRAFLSAFPSTASLLEMLSYGYGLKESATNISSQLGLSGSIERLLNWATQSGQLDALLSAAAAYNPGNIALRSIIGRQEWRNAEPAEALLQEFRARFNDLSSLERYSLLQTIYRRIPVPAFYQELSRLMKAGFIRHVLTTNIDSLLEQALESQGLSRDTDFEVILLGTETSRDVLSRLEADANTPLIIKLHGDISQGEFGVTPDEIDYAVHTAKRFIRDELQGDLMIVGYEGESRPLNDWLARAPGEVWWVHDEITPGVTQPPNGRFIPMSPSDVFPVLAARVLTLRATVKASPAPASVARGLPPVPPAPPAPLETAPAPATEHDLLAQEIERLRAEALALEQASSLTGTALQRQEQIAQRRRRIREVEDQLRALPAARNEILQLLDRVQQSVVEAGHQTGEAAQVDAQTLQFLVTQLDTLRDQYKGGPLNLNVVSAALGATLVLAERLGPTVIDPQDAQALAAFGPTLAGRS